MIEKHVLFVAAVVAYSSFASSFTPARTTITPNCNIFSFIIPQSRQFLTKRHSQEFTKKNLIIEDGMVSKEEMESSYTDKEYTDDECDIITSAMSEDLKSIGSLEPLERQLTRLDGFEPYILVSVLTATASHQALIEQAILANDSNILQIESFSIFLTSLGSTLCGMYSALVFALSILYGKTALGMDRTDAYYYFLDQTATKRQRAFQFFSASLAFFCANILILAVYKLPPEMFNFGVTIAVGISLFGCKEWRDLADAAVPIFTNVIPSDNKKDTTTQNSLGNKEDDSNRRK